MTLLDIVLKKIEAHTKRCQDSYSTLQKNLIKSMEEVNFLPPNIDKDGRLHSPENGYQANGQVYAKGVYIPHHFSLDDGEEAFFAPPKSKKFKERILVSGEILEELKNIKKSTNIIDFSFGSMFSRYCEDAAYLYVKAPSIGYLNIVKNTIKNIMDVKEKEIKEEIEISKQEEKEKKGDAPIGKQEQIKGEIISIRAFINKYTHNAPPTYKMLLRLENNSTVWGSLPKSIIEAKEGDVIVFNASFELKDKNDTTHANFKSPTKAHFLEDDK